VARTGRPRNQVGARRLLDEAQTLPKRHPAVARLLDMLAAGDADEAEVETALNDAVVALKAMIACPQPQVDLVVSKTKRVLSPPDRLIRLSQDKRILARLSAVVQAELTMVEMDLAEAEIDFRRWALSQPRIEQYRHNFLARLEAVGFNAHAARKISNDDLRNFMEPFSDNQSIFSNVLASNTKPTIVEKPEIKLAWCPDTPWVEILQAENGFQFVQRPSSPTELLKWRRCGLPPYQNLDDYGCPELFHAFQSAKDGRAKSTLSWKICESWLKNNVKYDIEAAKVRENAWIFLFGLRYGYHNDLGNMNYVLFPSPTAKDTVLCAQCKNRSDST
jgi:hypothetical protein